MGGRGCTGSRQRSKSLLEDSHLFTLLITPAPSLFEPDLRSLALSWSWSWRSLWLHHLHNRLRPCRVLSRTTHAPHAPLSHPSPSSASPLLPSAEVLVEPGTGGAAGKTQRQAYLSKTISQQWIALSPEERAKWEELAKEKKQEHEKLHPGYVTMCIDRSVRQGGRILPFLRLPHPPLRHPQLYLQHLYLVRRRQPPPHAENRPPPAADRAHRRNAAACAHRTNLVRTSGSTSRTSITLRPRRTLRQTTSPATWGTPRRLHSSPQLPSSNDFSSFSPEAGERPAWRDTELRCGATGSITCPVLTQVSLDSILSPPNSSTPCSPLSASAQAQRTVRGPRQRSHVPSEVVQSIFTSGRWTQKRPHTILWASTPRPNGMSSSLWAAASPWRSAMTDGAPAPPTLMDGYFDIGCGFTSPAPEGGYEGELELAYPGEMEMEMGEFSSVLRPTSHLLAIPAPTRPHRLRSPASARTCMMSLFATPDARRAQARHPTLDDSCFPSVYYHLRPHLRPHQNSRSRSRSVPCPFALLCLIYPSRCITTHTIFSTSSSFPSGFVYILAWRHLRVSIYLPSLVFCIMLLSLFFIIPYPTLPITRRSP
ncbi:hypothetical protein K438DRAFT_590981 [Mycena galopus ATCC 62051]|nr:hypothetical protein K438DRAFT_590981 [Mycena galopus ATCC 62051]